VRRKGILVLVVALAATLVVGVSAAFAARKYSTDIVFLGNSTGSVQDVTLYGDVDANAKCVTARTVGLFKQTSNGYKLLDVDLSSFNGAWALRADLTGTPNLAIKVQKEARRDRRNRRFVCKGATLKLSPSSSQYPQVG
jgi:hypothetical protein